MNMTEIEKTLVKMEKAAKKKQNSVPIKKDRKLKIENSPAIMT